MFNVAIAVAILLEVK